MRPRVRPRHRATALVRSDSRRRAPPAWFVDKLALLLDEHGVTVLVSTDNAAEALGAVVAEQPDIVLVGDRLAMMPVDVLLADVRLFAPDALLAVAASDPQRAGTWRAHADAVFLRNHPRATSRAPSALCTPTPYERSAAHLNSSRESRAVSERWDGGCVSPTPRLCGGADGPARSSNVVGRAGRRAVSPVCT